MSSFGKRLKKLRLEAGLNNCQLANILGVSNNIISYYERRNVIPRPAVLIKISKHFKVSIDYLLCNDNVCESRDINSVIQDLYDLTHKELETIHKLIHIIKE